MQHSGYKWDESLFDSAIVQAEVLVHMCLIQNLDDVISAFDVTCIISEQFSNFISVKSVNCPRMFGASPRSIGNVGTQKGLKGNIAKFSITNLATVVYENIVKRLWMFTGMWFHLDSRQWPCRKILLALTLNNKYSENYLTTTKYFHDITYRMWQNSILRSVKEIERPDNKNTK